MTARASFTEADIQRAVKAARKAGLSVAGIDFPRHGGFRLIFGEPPRLDTISGAGANEWDVVLPS
jgi:hypothetical protein